MKNLSQILLISGLFLLTNTFLFSQNAKFQFVENKNQWEETVKFRAKVPNGYLFLKENSLIYSFYDARKLHSLHPSGQHHHHHKKVASRVRSASNFIGETGVNHSLPVVEDTLSGKIQAHAFQVKFLGANENLQVLGEKKKPFAYNYFQGEKEQSWASEAGVFEGAVYSQIYEGVDLQFLQTELDLKYEFRLKPKANSNQIKMQYDGMDSIYLRNGHLYIKTSLNTVIEHKPFSYQIIEGDTIEVESAFHLENNTLSFDFPKGYDPAFELVIDPVLIFASYSGSFADNWGNTATYGEDGAAYVAGIVFGENFPTTIGAFEVDFQGQQDVLVFKYNESGTDLIYGTVLGGSGSEVPTSLIENSRGELVVMGITESNNYPTTFGAHDRTFGGGFLNLPFPRQNNQGNITISEPNFGAGTDLFITVLNSTGSDLIGSTYLGGSGNDGITGGTVLNNTIVISPQVRNYGDSFRGEVALDRDDNIYIGSSTESTNFGATGGAFDATLSGIRDGVVAKLNANVSNLDWATYLGGDNVEGVYSIEVDNTGNVIVSGATNSTNFPTTNGVIDGQFNGGTLDGFVSILSPNGNNIVASTYLGTSNYEQAYMLSLDDQNNIAVFGQTLGNYPVTNGVFSNTNGRQFVHKLSPDLRSTVFSTRFGAGRSTPDIVPTAFTITECNTIYLAGWGGSTNSNSSLINSLGGSTTGMPVTNDAFQSNTDGSDFYLMVLSANAEDLLFGSYIGADSNNSSNNGDHVDGGTSRFDPKGIIYQAVCSCQGSGFPTTAGAFSNANNSTNCNMVAFKFDLTLLQADFETSVESGCAPLDLNFENRSTGGVDFVWDLGNGDVVNLSSNQSFNYTYTESGTYFTTLTVSDPTTCTGVDIHRDTVEVFGTDFGISPDTLLCSGETLQLAASGGVNYQWLNTENLSDPNIASPNVFPESTTTYSVLITNEFGCQDTLEVTVEVPPIIDINFEFELLEQCENPFEVRFDNQSTGVNSVTWLANGQPFSQSLDDFNFTFDQEGEIEISLTTDAPNPCGYPTSISKTFTVDFPEFNPPSDTVICANTGFVLEATGLENFQWSPATGLDNPNSGTPFATPSETTTYTLTTFNENCSFSQEVRVEVVPEIELDFDFDFTVECGGIAQLELTNNSSGGVTYEWFFGDGASLTSANPPSYRYSEAGTYTITLLAKNGECEEELSKDIVVEKFDPPNVFTPNNDGVNDLLFISNQINGWRLEIFNRWGEQVFVSESYQNDWGGDDLPSGSYLYLLTSPTGESCRGWIQILF